MSPWHLLILKPIRFMFMLVVKKKACLHCNNVVLTRCPPQGWGLWRWCLHRLPAAGRGCFPHLQFSPSG